MDVKDITRREALAIITMGILAGCALDQTAGFIDESLFLRSTPQTEVVRNDRSNRSILVVGGEGNDGIAIARGMRPYLLPIGSVIGLRYAQTNVDAEPLSSAVTAALETNDLTDTTLDVYLNSAAGPIMAEPLRRLAATKQLGTVILDGSPHSQADVKGFEGELIKFHADCLKHSRVVGLLTRLVARFQIPPASDKAAGVSLAASRADRQAIIHADPITLGDEAADIRTGVPKGLLIGAAQTVIFLHSLGEDPLIHNQTALAGWRPVYGAVLDYTDTQRPKNSHAAAPTYPLGLANILART